MENNKRYESGLNVMEELFSQEVRTGMEEIKKISPDLWEYDCVLWLWRSLH